MRLTIWAIASLAIAISLAACGAPNRDWSVVDLRSPAAPGSTAPHLAVTPEGEALMSWLEPRAGETHTVRFAILGNEGWSEPRTVAEGTNWFINWADFPSVVPIMVDHWAAHWLVKRPGGTYSYDIALAISADRGTRWSKPLTPHRDNTPTEHGFVTLFPWAGDIGAVWLDGRQMQPDMRSDEPRDVNDYGGMSLRFARLDYNGGILDEGKIDGLVCECCQTDVALATDGPVLTYRNRTPDEIRDIAVTRYVNDGWTEPATISDDAWHIRGCPVNGPAIAAQGDRVAIAWYGAPNRERRVKLAWSEDAGETFSTPLVVDEGNVSGRVDVVVLADGAAIVSWTAKAEDGTGQLRVREVSVAGDRGPVQIIAEGEYSRGTGFPQMVRARDRLVFAWPEPGEPAQALTASVPLTP